jgi:hypothetical protein
VSGIRRRYRAKPASNRNKGRSDGCEFVPSAENKGQRQATKDQKRADDAARILSLATVTGKFPTLIIDPPWPMQSSAVWPTASRSTSMRD